MDTAYHILVVDDDTRIRELLSKYLVDHGFYISSARDAEEAVAQMGEFAFDLLVLDVMMPGKTGVELTQALRTENNHIPILMLTAMGEVGDRISGLAAGADDYLAKPFEPEELLLRIQRILARTHQPRSAKTPGIRIGEWQWDGEKGHLEKGEEILVLTEREVQALRLLTEQANQLVAREKLAEYLGGMNLRSVDVLITRLRNKLEPNPKQPRYLKTIRGEGYTLYVDKI